MRIVGATAFCSRGGIGRRVRLRTVWGNPWRFESSREQLLACAFAEARLTKPPSASGEDNSRTICDFERPTYLLPAPFLRAAQRAFISWERRFRPAGVIPPFFLAGVVFFPAFSLAQRALAAAASLARVAADIRRRPPRVATLAGAPPRIEERRFSKVSICRRIETASCKATTDISIPCQIAGVSCNGNQLF